MVRRGSSSIPPPIGFLVGGVLALTAWMVLVPWDLSELTEDGRLIEGGGDDSGAEIAAVALVVVAGSVAALAHRVSRRAAAAIAAGGLLAWTILFAWRAGVANTSGANMFMVPLVTICIPALVAVPVVLRSVSAHLDHGSPSPSD